MNTLNMQADAQQRKIVSAAVRRSISFKCPKCKQISSDYPALSRRDNKTEICSACGVEEALFDFANRKQ